MIEHPYDIGETFLMNILLTPELQEVHKTEYLIVEAIYRGVKKHEEALEDHEDGNIKILAMMKNRLHHYVVEYAGILWINDLVDSPGMPRVVSMKKIDEIDLREETNSEETQTQETDMTVETETTPAVEAPRPSIRHLNRVTKQWNIEGLLADHRDTDEPVQVCSITGEELFYVRGDNGRTVNLRTHGVCAECGNLYSESAMHNDGVSKSPWPVIYDGGHCTNCWPNRK